MAILNTLLRPRKNSPDHGNVRRRSCTARLTMEALESRALLAAGASSALPIAAADQAAPDQGPVDTALIQVVDAATRPAQLAESSALTYGGAAGSFAWLPGFHEAYEDLQAIREIQQLAELRHAFDALFGSDEAESWSWSVGDQPGTDHGSLLDLPESPSGPAPGLPLGYGENGGDPRDPESMVHMPTEERSPFGPGGAPSGEGSDDGVHDGFERIGWVADKDSTSDPEILRDRTGREADGSTSRVTVSRDRDGFTDVRISYKSRDGATVTIHVRTRDGGPTAVAMDARGPGQDATGFELDYYRSGAWSDYIDAGYDSHGDMIWHHESHDRPPLLPVPRDERPDSENHSWFSPLHPDAWATFLAWYTHHYGTGVYRPGDDFDTSPDDGSSSSGGSAAPRIGIDAVINPGGADWAPSVPGGGGGTDGGGRPDDPFPEPPSSK